MKNLQLTDDDVKVLGPLPAPTEGKAPTDFNGAGSVFMKTRKG